MNDENHFGFSDLNSQKSNKSQKSDTQQVHQNKLKGFALKPISKFRFAFILLITYIIFPIYIWIPFFIIAMFLRRLDSNYEIPSQKPSASKNVKEDHNPSRTDVIKIGGLNSTDGYGKQESNNSSLIWIVVLIAAFIVFWFFSK
jgi:hypothetical protein